MEGDPCRRALDATLPATLASVEALVREFRLHAGAGPGGATCFAVELLLREALANAVVHGCGNDPAKRIRCRVRSRRRHVTIAVADPGAGFDWRREWMNRPAASDCRGRGLEILRTYASRVRFNRAGNGVVILKRFGEKQ